MVSTSAFQQSRFSRGRTHTRRESRFPRPANRRIESVVGRRLQDTHASSAWARVLTERGWVMACVRDSRGYRLVSLASVRGRGAFSRCGMNTHPTRSAPPAAPRRRCRPAEPAHLAGGQHRVTSLETVAHGTQSQPSPVSSSTRLPVPSAPPTHPAAGQLLRTFALAASAAS
jgi:hypothetical protein